MGDSKLSEKNIQKKIQDAIDIVNDFDEPYRTKAFEVILTNSLGVSAPSKSIKKVTSGTKKLSIDEKIVKFAETLRLTVDQLENVFDFDEDGVNIVTPLVGSIPSKQVTITHCVLICLEHVYDKKSVSSSDLKKLIDDYGVVTKNLSRSLQNKSDIFRRVGKVRGTKYRLTDVGKTSGLELIRTLAMSCSQPM